MGTETRDAQIAKRRALRPASCAITRGGDGASDHRPFVSDARESLKLIRVNAMLSALYVIRDALKI
jgi:hypothetical protein